MPYKAKYNTKTVGSAPKMTPKEVQGNQGKPVSSTVNQSAWHYQSRPTGNKPFPQ